MCLSDAWGLSQWEGENANMGTDYKRLYPDLEVRVSRIFRYRCNRLHSSFVIN